MIDLRILRDRWTEDGGRQIFAELTTHCVRSIHPSAQSVRPNPGDEGLDTFVGEFQDELQVFQAKYFCNEVGRSQKSQIRKSWKSCTLSPRFNRVVSWTLCVPIELSTDEHSWWQRWRKNEMAKHNCQIELWAKSKFQAFSCQPELKSIFDHALHRGVTHETLDDVIMAIRRTHGPRPIEPLPTDDHLSRAIFVQKLELAHYTTHRAARTAFYNFELLRTAVEQGGTKGEQSAFADLRERVYALWEHAFNEHRPDRLGRTFVTEVERRVYEGDDTVLRSALPAGQMHKMGAVHDWADLCEAGWTEGHEQVGAAADIEDNGRGE